MAALEERACHIAVSASQSHPRETPCPRCGHAMVAATVRTAIWQGSRVAIVENIPAYICDACSEQCYDQPVSDALRRLAEDGFPSEAADEQITVPVFSLQGRVKEPKAIPEDVYVD